MQTHHYKQKSNLILCNYQSCSICVDLESSLFSAGVNPGQKGFGIGLEFEGSRIGLTHVPLAGPFFRVHFLFIFHQYYNNIRLTVDQSSNQSEIDA